jgi:alkylhydroperoxidase family enzyme
MAAWSACVAGSLDVDTYVAKLQAAGFSDVAIFDLTPTDFGSSAGVADGAAHVAAGLAVGDLKQWLASAMITAHKKS